MPDGLRFRPYEPVLDSGVYAAITNTGTLGQFALPAGACFPPQNATDDSVWYEAIGLYQTISH